MQISILNVQSTTQTAKSGKPYQQLEVAYKNLTFQGKIESKKLMPFGAQKAAFDALANAAVGSTFEVTVVKNDAGYNDWTACVQAAPGSVAVASGSINNAAKPTAGTTMQVKSTYETPEERAKKQVYIIRQSSLSSAISMLTPGAKSPIKLSEVTDVADELFAWVMQDPNAAVKQDLFDVPNDNDEVM
jgi:hypothetical protein